MLGGLTMFPYMNLRVVLHPKQVAVMRNSFCLQSSFWVPSLPINYIQTCRVESLKFGYQNM